MTNEVYLVWGLSLLRALRVLNLAILRFSFSFCVSISLAHSSMLSWEGSISSTRTPWITTPYLGRLTSTLGYAFVQSISRRCFASFSVPHLNRISLLLSFCTPWIVGAGSVPLLSCLIAAWRRSVIATWLFLWTRFRESSCPSAVRVTSSLALSRRRSVCSCWLFSSI